MTIAAGINDPLALVAGDFDGDGRLDLAVAVTDTFNFGDVSVLRVPATGRSRSP